jgi:hypothetical protein
MMGNVKRGKIKDKCAVKIKLMRTGRGRIKRKNGTGWHNNFERRKAKMGLCWSGGDTFFIFFRTFI